MRVRWGHAACLLTVAGACGGRVVAGTQDDVGGSSGGVGTGSNSGAASSESNVAGDWGTGGDPTTAATSGGGIVGGGQGLGIGGGCASVAVQGELTPINLILVYDKSGSMGVGDGWDNTETRWNLSWLALSSAAGSFSISDFTGLHPIHTENASSWEGHTIPTPDWVENYGRAGECMMPGTPGVRNASVAPNGVEVPSGSPVRACPTRAGGELRLRFG